MSERGSSSCSTACDFAGSSSDSVTFNQISVGVAVLLRDENCCAAVLRRAFLMWRDARRALRHDRVLLRLSALLTAAWMRLARRTLRHDRVLFRLSVVLTATWMRLARGALRFERARLAWMRLARGALRFERARQLPLHPQGGTQTLVLEPLWFSNHGALLRAAKDGARTASSPSEWVASTLPFQGNRGWLESA